MALTNDNIYRAKNIINDALSEMKKMTSEIESFNNFIVQNRNYVSYSQNTSVGESMREKFESIFSLINTDLIPKINKITNETNEMLNNQLEINEEQV